MMPCIWAHRLIFHHPPPFPPGPATALMGSAQRPIGGTGWNSTKQSAHVRSGFRSSFPASGLRVSPCPICSGETRPSRAWGGFSLCDCCDRAILDLDEKTLFASIAPPAKRDLRSGLFAWRRGRAAEGTRLLNEHTPKGYRGFESLRLRHPSTL